MTAARHCRLDPLQEELALSSIASHRLFPGRTTLLVGEVAMALKITVRHVLDLIEEYTITGGVSGILAVNVAGAPQSAANPRGNRSSRAFWRIPVSAYDEFLGRQKNSITTPSK